MQRLHYGVIALALLAGTSIGAAQQNKTHQNAADEALTRSAPEAKGPPPAPAGASQNQASQPGIEQQATPFTDGRLTVPGAPRETQDDPAKFSAKNDKLDKTPIMAYPLALTDEQKHTISQYLNKDSAPASNLTAKVAEEVPATLALQELPQEMAASMPSVRDYKFLRLNDRILVINPRESIVVGEITN